MFFLFEGPFTCSGDVRCDFGNNSYVGSKCDFGRGDDCDFLRMRGELRVLYSHTKSQPIAVKSQQKLLVV